ncbi:MAG: ATP-binding protein [Crocinitomicaceae bacterium]
MIKIAITGPECSGKTTLAIALGQEFDISWIPEFSRVYLSKLDRSYKQEDLDVIAQKQQNAIDLIERIGKGKYLITDTEMTVMKIWSQEKYQDVSETITTLWQQQSYDLYLLCKPDIPYENDPLRENPDDRDRLYEIYKAELISKGVHFVEIEGLEFQRKAKALKAIEDLNSN